MIIRRTSKKGALDMGGDERGGGAHPYHRFLDVLAAHPARVAIVKGGCETSFQRVADAAAQMVPGMAAAGVAAGRAVLVQVPNGAHALAAVVAIWALGGVPALQSPKAVEGHRQSARAQLDPALVLDADSLADLAAQHGEGRSALPRPSAGGQNIASIVFTSGSTGMPKGICQTGASLVDGAQRLAHYQGYSAVERILCPVPWSHDYGWGQVLSCLTLGHTLILPEGEGSAALTAALRTMAPTMLAGVPSLFSGLVFGISDLTAAETGGIMRLTSTGSRFPAGLRPALAKLFPNAVLYRNYGLTETFRTACLMPDAPPEREGSLGRAIPGVEVVALDPEGRVLSAGQEGELAHIGPGIFSHYLGLPERTAQTRRPLPDGRLAVATGDLGCVDAEGWITLTGRRDRQIKSMDVGVNLDTVEGGLMATELLAAVAVVSAPHQMLGTKIIAHCVPRPGVTPRDVKRAAKAILSKYMLPFTWHFEAELPRTPGGKTDYARLAAQAESPAPSIPTPQAP